MNKAAKKFISSLGPRVGVPSFLVVAGGDGPLPVGRHPMTLFDYAALNDDDKETLIDGQLLAIAEARGEGWTKALVPFAILGGEMHPVPLDALDQQCDGILLLDAASGAVLRANEPSAASLEPFADSVADLQIAGPADKAKERERKRKAQRPSWARAVDAVVTIPEAPAPSQPWFASFDARQADLVWRTYGGAAETPAASDRIGWFLQMPKLLASNPSGVMLKSERVEHRVRRLAFENIDTGNSALWLLFLRIAATVPGARVDIGSDSWSGSELEAQLAALE